MNRPWTRYYHDEISKDIDIDKFQNISQLLETSVDKYSKQIALTCLGTDVSYKEYNEFATSFAAYFQNNTSLEKEIVLQLWS